MSFKKLLDPKVKTTLVKEWSLSEAQIEKLTKDTGEVSPIQKIKSPKLDLKVEELRIFPEKFLPEHLLLPHGWWPSYFCRPRYRVRKNQKNLTPIEWNRFIHAIEALADSDMPTPTYQEFVQIHVQAMSMAGMTWGAHNGVNFLTWHREYLAKLEARLMAINPLVTIPYWNWIEDRVSIPAALSNSADLVRWGVTRLSSFNGSSIATAANHSSLMALGTFSAFSSMLEASPFHNRIHGLVGGTSETMATSSSPADPIFWLHHCFIDKLFADWQVLHPAITHPNPTEILQPPPIMTRKNSEVWNIHSLGYVYQ